MTAGTPLFTLVETGDAWVEANFKETQLTHMTPGQAADGRLRHLSRTRPFKATVEAIGAGTGAEFSLLPAQNATGNWVKVTQRVPVRLQARQPDDAELALRTGMSATVDGRHRRRRAAWPTCSAAAHGRRITAASARPCPPQPDDLTEVAASRPDHRLDHAGDDHAGARHHDRQRRAAVDDGRPRRRRRTRSPGC